MDESLFVRVVIKDNIKVASCKLSSNVADEVSSRLRFKYEGKCSRHGYIRRDSIQVLKISLGKVEMGNLNGDVTYVVQYSADVCNPTTGSVVTAVVRNRNQFAILAETGVRFPDGSYVTVLEIIVARQTVGITSEVDLDDVRINDSITVEVLAKKFELGDTKITVVGRVLSSTKPQVEADIEVDPSDMDSQREEDGDEDGGGGDVDELDELAEMASEDGEPEEELLKEDSDDDLLSTEEGSDLADFGGDSDTEAIADESDADPI